MSILTLSPSIFIASFQYIRRLQFTIFLIVPFRSQRRIQGEYIIAFDPKHSLGTIRAQRTIRTNSDLRKPCMTIFTMPPDFQMTALMYGIRGQGAFFS